MKILGMFVSGLIFGALIVGLTNNETIKANTLGSQITKSVKRVQEFRRMNP